MAKIIHSLIVHYSINDIKRLIVSDLRGRGFQNVNETDITEPIADGSENRRAFCGYEIRKELPVPDAKPYTGIRTATAETPTR